MVSETSGVSPLITKEAVAWSALLRISAEIESAATTRSYGTEYIMSFKEWMFVEEISDRLKAHGYKVVRKSDRIAISWASVDITV